MKAWLLTACFVLFLVPSGFALSLQTSNPLQPELEAKHKAHKAVHHKAHKAGKHQAHQS
jgi:hypothetical protein